MDASKDTLSTITHQLFGGVLLILSIAGFLVYMMFIVVVISRKKFKTNSFFIIAACLGIVDCLTLLIFMSYTAPNIILNKDLGDQTRFAGGVLNIGWFTSFPLILLLAFNRYLCICRTELSKKVYTRRKSYYYCIASWCFGLVYSLASFFDCCPLYFDFELMSWQWNIKKYGAEILGQGDLVMAVLVTVGTFTCNGFVIRRLHLSHNSNSSLSTTQENHRLARERKIFIQFFITNIWLVILDVPFLTMGYSKEPSNWLGYFVTITYVINCSINGWVYLILNRPIRKEIKEWVQSIVRQQSETRDLGGIRDPIGTQNLYEIRDPSRSVTQVIPETQVGSEIQIKPGTRGQSKDPNGTCGPGVVQDPSGTRDIGCIRVLGGSRDPSDNSDQGGTSSGTHDPSGNRDPSGNLELGAWCHRKYSLP